MTWSGRLIVYLQPFQELVCIFELVYSSPTAFLFMALAFGHFYPLLYKILKLPLIRFFIEFGVSPLVVTLILFI